MTRLEEGQKGYNGISLTNYNSQTLDAAIAQGSVVEIGGALYEFTTDETLTGFSGLSNRSRAFLELTASGATVTGAWTATVPTWDDDKQGWYTTTKRVVATAWKDGSGNQTAKRLLVDRDVTQLTGVIDINGSNHTVSDFDAPNISVTTGASHRTITLPTVADNVGRDFTIWKADSGVGRLIIDAESTETVNGSTTQREIVHEGGLMKLVALPGGWKITEGEFQQVAVNLGAWNMDVTTRLLIAHNLSDRNKVRTANVGIQPDSGTVSKMWLVPGEDGLDNSLYTPWADDTNIEVRRLADLDGGFFDGETSLDSTTDPANRGWLYYVYDTGAPSGSI